MLKKENPIKTLIILPSLEGGGAERVSLTLLEKINQISSKIQADLFLLQPFADYKIINPNYHIFTTNIKEQLNFVNIIKVYQKLKKIAKKYDLIIGGMEFFPSYIGYLVSKALEKKFIAWVHITLSPILLKSGFIKRYLFNRFYSKFKYLVFPSQGAKEDYKQLISNNQCLKVIPNPIDIDIIHKLSNDEIKEKIVLSKPYIISIGALKRRKGFDTLIKAFYKLSKEHKYINLVILGKGKQKENLLNLIREKKLEERVFLLGFKENPYPYLKHAKFFVLPSRLEGFSMVILEALALGKAVISTNCTSGPSEILENGEYGVLVPVDDVEALYQAMKNFLENPQVVSYYESKAIERAKYYSPDKIVKLWEEFIIDVLNEKN